VFVVRLQIQERDRFDYKAFAGRSAAMARFLGGRLKVIGGDFREAAIFNVRTTDARTAIEMVKAGKAALVDIFPEPNSVAKGEPILKEV
jgi:hypothetical protein